MIKAARGGDGSEAFGCAELGGHCVCGWRSNLLESGRQTPSFVSDQEQA